MEGLSIAQGLVKSIKSKKMQILCAETICLDVWAKQDPKRPELTIGHVYQFYDGSELTLFCEPY